MIGELARRKDLRIKEVEPFLKPEDAAEILAVDPSTVRKWAKAGFITHFKIGTEEGPGTIRFRASALEKFVRRFTIRAVEEAVEGLMEKGEEGRG